MKTLYREFISTTLLILGISILIGFILANVVYVIFTKEEITRKHGSCRANRPRSRGNACIEPYRAPFLESVGQLGIPDLFG